MWERVAVERAHLLRALAGAAFGSSESGSYESPLVRGAFLGVTKMFRILDTRRSR